MCPDRPAYGLGVKARAPRRKVLIRARLKAPDGWHDACIVDLSSRGAGLQAANPPARGTYVEIRRGTHFFVARVMWRSSHRFGVHAQDDIPLDLAAPGGGASPSAEAVPGHKIERRRVRRSLAERAEASRTWGRRAQFALAALAGMAGALMAGAGVRDALAAPLEMVGSALDR